MKRREFVTLLSGAAPADAYRPWRLRGLEPCEIARSYRSDSGKR